MFRFGTTYALAAVTFLLSSLSAGAVDVEWDILKPSNTGIPGEQIEHVAWAPDGKMWVSGIWGNWPEGGVGIYDFDTQIWTTYANWDSPLPSMFVNDIKYAADGAAWLATSRGIVRFDGETWTIYDTSNSPLLHNTIDEIEFDLEGHLWINNSGASQPTSAIFEFDGTNWTMFQVGQELPWQQPWHKLSTIMVDHQGHVWTANLVLDGIAEYDGETWTLYGDGVDRFGEMAEDVEGNIWLVSGIGGWETFWKFDGTRFEKHPIGPSLSIATDNDGTVYAGDWNGRVRKTTDGGETWQLYLSGLNSVRGIYPDPQSDNVLIQTTGAVGHFNSSGQLIRDYNSWNTGLPWYWIDFNMGTDRSGNLWLSVGESGASRFDGERWRNWGAHNAGAEPWPFGPGNEWVCGMYEALDGTHYMGGAGIAKFDHELTEVIDFWNYENNPEIIGRTFWHFAEDMNGTLFAFSKHATPFRYEPEFDQWVQDPFQPSGTFYFPGAIADSLGNIWVSTWFYLYKWDGSAWTQTQLPYPDYFFDMGGVIDFKIGPDGKMYFGTFDGLVIYDGQTFTHFHEGNSPLPAKQVMGLDVRNDGLIGLACWTNVPIEPYPSAVVVIDGPPSSPDNWHSWLYGESPLTDFQTDEVSFDANGDLWVAAWSEGVVVLKTGVAFIQADIDGDGDVDLFDCASLFDCVTGPEQPTLPGCEDADLDQDGDVDFHDFSRFQLALSQH